MIVLDEHLGGLGVADAVRQWYRGRVCLVTELRPGSVVKDDGICALLRTADRPTFVTINWNHFWQHAAAHRGYCLICLILPTERASEISNLLRRLFRLAEFRTRTARLGKIARISAGQVSFYDTHQRQITQRPLP